MTCTLKFTCRLVAMTFVAIGGFVQADEPSASAKTPTAVYRRTVFLGDSITDGDTYPKLVRDAIANAGLPKMIGINAGIGGDTAKGMRARLERDVLAFHPTLVTLSVGANDAFRVTAESYESDVRAIADRLRQEHIPLIILTPNIAGPKFGPAQKNLETYEKILRQIAKEQGLRVAEVNQAQKRDEAAGRHQLAPDDVHPNWEGQMSLARAVLDALGYVDVKVPDKIADAPMPGVIPQWKVTRVGLKDPALTEITVAEVKPQDSWITIKLPETTPIPDYMDTNERWIDGYRAQGASVVLRQQPAGKYIGVASLHSDTARTAQFHTGGDLRAVWLNGKRIYQNTVRRGYHIGRESVSGEMKQGENTVVIETGPVFFLSVTKGEIWAEMGRNALKNEK